MPGYKGHLAGGVVVAAPMLYLLRSYLSPVLAALCFGFALAGSLFPDVDTNSKGQKWFYRLTIPFLVFLLIIKRFSLFVLFSFLAFVPLVVNHRGVFHRLWFIMLPPFGIVAVCAWYWPSWFHDVFFTALFFVVGAVSHLILDFGIRRTFKFRW